MPQLSILLGFDVIATPQTQQTTLQKTERTNWRNIQFECNSQARRNGQNTATHGYGKTLCPLKRSWKQMEGAQTVKAASHQNAILCALTQLNVAQERPEL